jgi:eukaryotic-like serine/threonine-protein kinase
VSPEQARGQQVDKRADIWAFGCILFELLSGQRAFRGATPADTIAAVLERQPDWSVLPDAMPASLRPLLRRCLEKDAHRRLHDIADARIEIDDAMQPTPDRRPNRSRSSRIGKAHRVAAGAAILTAGAIALGWSMREWSQAAPSGVPMTQFTWSIPAAMRLESPPAVSPDGQQIAFTASMDGGPSGLYVRPLSVLDAAAIPRTEGAMQPFWSPDGRALAYFARGKLMKVALDGGAPVEICAAGNPRGGTWGRDGVIVFQPGSIYSGLSRVSSEGGTPEPVTLLDSAQGENAHRWPVFLPDGIHFLYFVRSIVAERRGVYLGRIDRPASIPGVALFRSESEAVFAPLDSRDRGVLLNVAEGHIEVHPFDPHRYTVTGDPTILPLPVGGNTPHHASMLSVSADVLTHVSSSLPYGQRLVSSTRTGEHHQLDASPSMISWPRVSPEGTRIVVQRLHAVTGSPDLWVENIDRGTRIRVTEEGTSGQLPVWSPDGTRLAYVAGCSTSPSSRSPRQMARA